MMHPFTLYYGSQIVTIDSDEPLGPVLRLCSTHNEIFLLDKDHRLHTGVLEDGLSEQVHLTLLRSSIIDIDLFDNILYIVEENGSVFMTNVTALPNGEWEEIFFRGNDAQQKVQICRVKCNSIGSLFISMQDEAYGCGKSGDILITKSPVKLECFDERKICDISAGVDFFVVITRSDSMEDEGEDNSSVNSLDVRVARQPKKPNTFAVETTKTLKRNETFEFDMCSDEENNSSENSDTNKNTQDEENLKKRVKDLVRRGYNIVSTSVHSFGSRNGGLLGTGDHIRRSGLNTVLSLKGIGVCSISCGQEHSIARTIDGRIFQWGMNDNQQMDISGEIVDLSAPKELRLDNCAKSAEYSILEACCGDLRTFLLNSDLDLIEISKNPIKRDFVLQNVYGIFPFILSSNDFILQNHKTFAKEYETFLTSIQTSVKNLIQNKFQLEFMKFLPNATTHNITLLEEAFELYHVYLRITYVLALCLQTMDSFYRQDADINQLLFISHSTEILAVYNEYSELYCDIESISGFDELKKSIKCVDIGLYPECEDIFYHPFMQISNIIKFLECLVKNNEDDTILKDKLVEWQTFFNKNQIEIELAENSKDFWEKMSGNAQLSRFKQPHRRVILDTSRVSLKLNNGGKFSTNSFILFSDFLCQWGSTLQICPLATVWVKRDNDNSLRIITPEKRFTLTAKNHEDKMLWYDQFEKSINAVLERPLDEKLSKVRTAVYKYSERHTKFPDVHCFGRWVLGEMHGICHLEYPDGKIYFGEVKFGEIEGYGKMLLPSVGLYEGSFKGGKFNGNGMYEMRDNEIYEGNFRDGLFHGHGMLRGKTETFVGQFLYNSKRGYGILDDAILGDKYMGMFNDNKRSGPGICITMNGDYFEGIYKNDVLVGEGLAILENGCYYIGELTTNGPNGLGKYYLPNSEVENARDIDKNEVYMNGSIIIGNLSGCWTDIKVINGSVSLNQTFLKYPSSIGEKTVNNSRKWSQLFENWEEEIFGGLQITDTHLIWSKIAIFMKKVEEREKIKDQDSTKTGRFFAKNITMQLHSSDISLKNSSSLDKISLRSTNSLYSKGSTLRLSTRRRAYSTETLFDQSKNNYRNHIGTSKKKSLNSRHTLKQFFWQTLYDAKFNNDYNVMGEPTTNNSDAPNLEFIPNFGLNLLTSDNLESIKNYLSQAFKDRRHPLYLLNQKISNCFYLSYGCWKVKPTPVLSSQAMCEWQSISLRMYHIVQKMFPNLPSTQSEIDGKIISHISLLYPIVLSEGIYSTLFVLYANKYSKRDELYRQRILSCEKKSDTELISFLHFESGIENIVNDNSYKEAITTLKQVKEKYCPHGMLSIIRKSMQLIDDAHKNSIEKPFVLGADDIMPLTIYLVLRAEVPHLGAELALLEDLLGSDFESEMSGFTGYCYTTIKATYEHIISDKFFYK